MVDWWNDNYIFRRPLSIDPVYGPIPIGHPISISLPESISLNSDKVRSDFADLLVLRLDGNDWEVLPRSVTSVDGALEIRFASTVEISARDASNYYLYYGNPELTDAPTVAVFTDSEWPIELSAEAPEIGYKRPGEHWINGLSTTTNSLATFTAAAVKLRLRCKLSQVGAIARVRLDGGAWEEVDLYSQTTQYGVVYTALSLTPHSGATPTNYHRLQIQVSGKRNPRATGKEVVLVGIDYEKFIVGSYATEEVLSSLGWRVH